MAVAYFEKGALVQRGNSTHILKMKLGMEWQMENCRTGAIDTVAENKLITELFDGHLEFIINKEQYSQTQIAKSRNILWRSLSPELQEAAKRSLYYVQQTRHAPQNLNGLTHLILKIATEIKDGKKPSVSTVKRWVRLYKASGDDIISLVPRKDKRGNRKSKVDPDVERLVNEAIDIEYLTRLQKTQEDAQFKAAELIIAHNELLPEYATPLPLPSLDYVRREIKKRDQFEVCLARHGREYARKAFRGALGSARSDGLLSKVEIDHSVFDVEVIDEVTGHVLGKPYLSMIIEVYTRCIMGFSIGFEPPSYTSVASTLLHAVSIKRVKERYPDLKHDWPCHGIFATLVMDNGSEFHSSHLEEAALRFGFGLQYLPRKTPWWKPHIERVLGTVNGEVAGKVEGKTFGNPEKRGDYKSKKQAIMTLSDMRHRLTKWIVDTYLPRGHNSLELSPLQKWKEAAEDFNIPYPTMVPDLAAALAKTEARQLSLSGIQFAGIQYNSDELMLLRAQLMDKTDKQVRIRYLPHNLNTILVEHPINKTLINVPAISQEQEYVEGLSEHQNNVIRKHARKKAKRTSLTLQELVEAKMALDKDAVESEERAILLKRKEAARYKASSTREVTRSSVQQARIQKIEMQDAEIENVFELPYSTDDTPALPTFVQRGKSA